MANEFYRAQHVKILELTGQLTKAIGAKPAASATEIKDILNKLSGVLSVHLTAEDNALYPRLIADSRPQISGLARRFQHEMGGLKKAFTSYATKWSSTAIAEKADVFARETRGIVTALTARIDRENREFYPLIGI
jgi:iron-sulfur cluster repair protein YtfE (RIC family)